MFIAAHVACCDMTFAKRLFDLMLQCNLDVWNLIVSDYIKLRDIVDAKVLFDKMLKHDMMLWNTVLNY